MLPRAVEVPVPKDPGGSRGSAAQGYGWAFPSPAIFLSTRPMKGWNPSRTVSIDLFRASCDDDREGSGPGMNHRPYRTLGTIPALFIPVNAGTAVPLGKPFGESQGFQKKLDTLENQVNIS